MIDDTRNILTYHDIIHVEDDVVVYAVRAVVAHVPLVGTFRSRLDEADLALEQHVQQREHFSLQNRLPAFNVATLLLLRNKIVYNLSTSI